jgi:predicted transcriptional regulator of viral defense system
MPSGVPAQTPADGPKPSGYRTESAHRRQISQIAKQQHGLVALWQLESFGLSASAVRTRVGIGDLHHVQQGVYAVGHSLLSCEGRFMAAVLACGPRAVLSHRSAAELWGLRTGGRPRVDVTAPCRRGRSPAGIDAHRSDSLRAPDRTTLRRIPCTSVARTLVDLAGVVGARELQNTITQAEVQRIFDLAALREVIDRSRGRRGVARLRLAMSLHDPRDERARGEFERRFLALCRRFGLPLPEVNSPLAVEGVQMEADFLWRDAGLIVETDDRRSHATIAAFEKDRRRDQRLEAAGWRVIRCTWRQMVDEPSSLSRTIRKLLESRRSPSM